MSKKPRPNTDLVWINWDDAVGGDRIRAEDIPNSHLAENWNLGWIEHEDDKRIVLCHAFSSTGEYEHTTIPQADIVDRIPVVRSARRKNAEKENDDPAS